MIDTEGLRSAIEAAIDALEAVAAAGRPPIGDPPPDDDEDDDDADEEDEGETNADDLVDRRPGPFVELLGRLVREVDERL